MRPELRSRVVPTQVAAVLVTYGSRWNLLQEAISAARDAGVGGVVVVDNGAASDVAAFVGSRFGGAVTVVSRPRNEGSAAGYRDGLSAAIDAGYEYLLLLDDDNVISRDALSLLCDAYNEHRVSIASADLVVVGFRPARHTEATIGRCGHTTFPRHSGVLGFSIIDVPAKLWRRVIPRRRRAPTAELPAVISLTTCSYGGMLFHSDLVKKFGVPDERFVLYADDTEYSGRITRGGGRILLVTGASIRDAEPSWNAEHAYKNSFVALLTAKDDLRAYYSVRNNVYLATHVWPRNRFALPLNRRAFLAILWIASRILRRPERYCLLRRAIADGENGRLGFCQQFALP